MQLDLLFVLVFMLILSLYYNIDGVILTALSLRISTETLLVLSNIYYQKQDLLRLLIGPVLGGGQGKWLAFQRNGEL